jgi:hypothetical protein
VTTEPFDRTPQQERLRALALGLRHASIVYGASEYGVQAARALTRMERALARMLGAIDCLEPPAAPVDDAGYTLGPISNGGMDPRNSPAPSPEPNEDPS